MVIWVKSVGLRRIKKQKHEMVSLAFRKLRSGYERKEEVMAKKIGVIGYGAIGSYLVDRIHEDKTLSLAFVYDIDKDRLSNLDDSLVLDSMEKARERETDLIVEVAHAEWVKSFAPSVLEFTDLLILSVTAFAEEGLQEKLDRAAKANNTNYYISHGGLVGLDGVRDGKDVIEELSITSIKPPEKWGIKEKIVSRKILYEGPTRKACGLFPRNVNVHASVAVHGLGFDRTISKVIADPEVSTMRHIIEVKGKGLAWTIDVQANPVGEVTGVYTPESAFRTAKRICVQEHGMRLI